MKSKNRIVKNYKILGTARNLRREMTPQERKLWYAFLKDYPVKIYKQRIIESFVVDFYCARASLVIEIDGLIHSHADHIYRDAERDKRLRAYGLEIVRIQNYDVDSDFSHVCTYIDQIIRYRLSIISSRCLSVQRSEESEEPQAKK